MGRNSILAIRTLSVGLFFLMTAGCQTAGRSAAPTGLTDRLATIETDRLADDSPGFADEPRPIVRANQAPPRSVQLALARSRTSDTDGGPLTMTDFGYASSYDEDGEYVPLSGADDRAERYNRRPPLDSFWETVKRDIKTAPKDLWRDTKLVYANPVNLFILGGTYGGALAVRETGVDKGIERHFQARRKDGGRTHHHIKKDWLEFFDAAGNPGTHFAMASIWYLIGQQAMDEKTYEVGKTMFSALMINGMTVIIGQAAHADRGPNGRYGTMPSGHTSSSFVVASVLHQAYGHVVGVPLYAIATFNGWQRVDSREHYLSDVIMGGVLGLVVGHSVASGRDPEFFGFKIVPWASPDGGVGVAFAKPLD